MDYSKWLDGQYTATVMANVLEWYEMSRLIESHVEDEKAKKIKKDARKKK